MTYNTASRTLAQDVECKVAVLQGHFCRDHCGHPAGWRWATETPSHLLNLLFMLLSGKTIFSWGQHIIPRYPNQFEPASPFLWKDSENQSDYIMGSIKRIEADKKIKRVSIFFKYRPITFLAAGWNQILFSRWCERLHVYCTTHWWDCAVVKMIITIILSESKADAQWRSMRSDCWMISKSVKAVAHLLAHGPGAARLQCSPSPFASEHALKQGELRLPILRSHVWFSGWMEPMNKGIRYSAQSTFSEKGLSQLPIMEWTMSASLQIQGWLWWAMQWI